MHSSLCSTLDFYNHSEFKPKQLPSLGNSATWDCRVSLVFWSSADDSNCSSIHVLTQQIIYWALTTCQALFWPRRCNGAPDREGSAHTSGVHMIVPSSLLGMPGGLLDEALVDFESRLSSVAQILKKEYRAPLLQQSPGNRGWRCFLW